MAIERRKWCLQATLPDSPRTRSHVVAGHYDDCCLYSDRPEFGDSGPKPSNEDCHKGKEGASK